MADPTPITPHADGRAAGAPALPLSEVLATRSKLRATGVDTADASSHIHDAKQERSPWAAMTDAQAVCSSEEHQTMASLFDTHAGDLDALASAVPASYSVSAAKIKARNPKTGQQFAWQLVEGYYTKDKESSFVGMSASGSHTLASLLALDFAFQHADNPEFASQSGNDDHGARLQDLSPGAFELRREHNRMVIARAKAIDPASLDTDEERLHLQLFLSDVTCELEALDLGCHLCPINSIGYGGVVCNFLEALDWNEDASASRSNFLTLLQRVEAFPRQVDQYIALLRCGIQKGVMASKDMVRKTADQIFAIAYDEKKSTPVDIALITSTGGNSGDEDERLRARVRDANASFKSACLRVEQFVRNEYAKQCRDTSGCLGLERGAEVYALALRYHTTTNMTADEIHAVGLSEIARIEKRYRDDVLIPLGYLDDSSAAGDSSSQIFRTAFETFVATSKEDSSQYYETKEALLEGYNVLCGEIRHKLPEYFESMPSSPLEIVEKDAETAPAAYYLAGTPDGRRPGRFYVNISNLKQRPKYEMVALALHEGIPGHHHQCALALENRSIPSFLRYLEDRRYEFCPARRQLYAAYLEGWALYCEALGEEMGLYGGDPMKIFGRLSMEMMRAVRLVVDTGIHHKGWSVERAIEYMMEKTGMHRHECEAECYRYEAWPGQACAYKIGEVAIWKMRREAEALLKQKFDLKQFHEVLLSSGPLPLDALEVMVQEWSRKLA